MSEYKLTSIGSFNYLQSYYERKGGVTMSIFDQGIEFIDNGIAMLARNWGNEVWLFVKHEDGLRWTSLRKCTKDDLKRLSTMIFNAHGPVVRSEFKNNSVLNDEIYLI